MNKLNFNRQRKKSGFANTKVYPHKNHPANYRRIGVDDIEYITFTHHDKVKVNNKTYETIPLHDNINIKVQKANKNNLQKDISFAYPKVYVGKRSALKSEITDCSFVEKDKILVNKLFDTLPKEKVNYTSNSKKSKKK